MNRVAAALCAAFLLVVLVPAVPAVAAEGPTATTVRDSRGDAKVRAGDIRSARLAYGHQDIVLTVTPARMKRLNSYPWRVGRTALIWLLEVTGDNNEDYVAWLYNDGYGNVRAVVERPNGRFACYATASPTTRAYRLRIERSCLNTPRSVAFQALFYFDTNPRDRNVDRAQSWDYAPNGAFSKRAFRPPYRTAVRVHTNHTRIPKGSDVVFNGYFFSEGGHSAPRPIEVWRRPHRSTLFEHVTTLTTDGGSFSYRETPEYSASYQFRFPGVGDLAPSVSPVHDVAIVRDVRTQLAHRTVPVGQETTLSGEVLPGAHGLPVTLQRRISETAWADVNSTTTTLRPDPTAAPENQAATFEFRITPNRAAALEYRVVVAADEVFADSYSLPVPLNAFRVAVEDVMAGDGPVADAQDPNREFVTIANTGSTSVYTAGWRLEANGADRTRLPDVALQPGQRVRVHSGSGVDTATDIYLRRSAPMWPEQGGVARLLTQDGLLVSERHYGATAESP